MSTGAVRGSSVEAGTPSGSTSSAATVSQKLYFPDIIKVEPNLVGCNDAAFFRPEGMYRVRWDKEVVETSGTSKKVGAQFKHGNVVLRMTFSRKNEKDRVHELANVKVTMQMLPSENSATGIIQLYNFIVNGRTSTGRKKVENVAMCAILSMYRHNLAVIANEALEVVCVTKRCIGTIAHEYLCRRFGFVRNDMGNCVVRMGDLLNKRRTNQRYASSPIQLQDRIEATRTAGSSSSSGVDSGEDLTAVSFYYLVFASAILDNLPSLFYTDTRRGK